jgi:hypothetical protein
MHFANSTHSDSFFGVSHLSRFATAHTCKQVGMCSVFHQVLKGHILVRVYLGVEARNRQFVSYCDVDSAGCTGISCVVWRSVTGYVIKCGESSMAWTDVRQATVSCSTTERESIAPGDYV